MDLGPWTDHLQWLHETYTGSHPSRSSPPAVDSESIQSIDLQNDFLVDLDQSEQAPVIEGEDGELIDDFVYSRLRKPERLGLFDQLHYIHGKSASQLYGLWEAWKRTGSYPRETTQTLEAIYKAAHDITGQIRGEVSYPHQPSIDEICVAHDLYLLSQAYILANYGENPVLHRGVWERPAAEFVAQALDKPEEDEFEITTSVVTNFSLLDYIGTRYSDGIVIRAPFDRKKIVAAVDQLKPSDRPSEAEIQVKGGYGKIPSRFVKHVGMVSEQEQPIVQTAERMESPQSFTIMDHRDIAELVVLMKAFGVRVGTADGAERIETWFQAAQEQMDLDSEKENRLTTAVEFVSEVDSDASWIED